MTVKARTHLILDTLIFITFAVTLVSGLILWFALAGGYQGGRNPAAAGTVLLLNRWAWRDVHNWFGLAMGFLGALHLILHLPWVVCHVKRLLGLDRRSLRRAARPALEGGMTGDQACGTP
jgi:hypothetical protein